MDETAPTPLSKVRFLLNKDIAILVTVLGLAGGAIYQMGRANQRIDDIDHRTAVIETAEAQVRELAVRIDNMQSQIVGVRADLGTRIIDTERRQKEADDRLQAQLVHITDLVERRFGPDGGK
jgi:multidrug resistance efflux pump